MKDVATRFLKPFQQTEVLLPLCLILMGLVVLFPLPGILLDLFLGLSFVLSLVILLMSLYIEKPVDFAIFPTILLFSTIFRLSLGLATTRAILMSGGHHTRHMSRLIRSVGEVIIGGNFLVGVVIFIILMIINFIVITKGSTRIAEVAARFTLDALPGKQMAIDAELNSGQITAEQARQRRRAVEREADFYGAMDGASKFVRGDAIATILITLVNLVIGFFNGVFVHHYRVLEAAQTFTILAMGDGLLSAVPGLLVSMAAGLIITRASSQGFLVQQVVEQSARFPRVFYISAVVMFGMALIPAFPFLPFLALTVLLGWLGRWSSKEHALQQTKQVETESPTEKETREREEALMEAIHIDPVVVEVGHGLVYLIDPAQQGELIERVRSLRNQIVQDLGFIIPSIRLRDNLQLKAYEYEVFIRGNSIAKVPLKPHHLLAMDPGHVTDPFPYEKIEEPVYGMEAIWIHESEKESALMKGYLVVNHPTIMTTHLSKLLKMNARELFSRKELKQRLDQIQEQVPKLVDDVIQADRLSYSDVLKVMHRLLEEGVSVKDMAKILECLADHSRYTKNPDLLSEQCRQALSRSLVKPYLNEDGELWITTFERSLEDRLRAGLERTEQGVPYLKVEPVFAKELIEKLSQTIARFDEKGSTPVLVIGAALRLAWYQILKAYLPQYVVLAFDEIPRDISVKVIHLIQ